MSSKVEVIRKSLEARKKELLKEEERLAGFNPPEFSYKGFMLYEVREHLKYIEADLARIARGEEPYSKS